MCRFLVLVSETPILLSQITTDPGDGFGIGWYEDPSTSIEARNEPCIFSAVTPAWSNRNLRRLAKKVRSRLVFAHVRASTTGALSEENCHPWSYGVLLFQHNGGVGDFNEKIKRKLQNALDDVYFAVPQGNTDSEWVFALLLQTLHELGADPLAASFDHRVLRTAMLNTIAKLNVWAKASGVETPSLLNLCLSDGRSVVATRYVSSREDEAASLYFSTGSSFCEVEPGTFRMRKHDKRESVILIASEPLTWSKDDWLEVPNQTCLVVTPNRNVLQVPIRDEYWQDGRTSRRDAGFAMKRGLFVAKGAHSASL